jgi:MtN3 and saliva related transmembrane protein
LSIEYLGLIGGFLTTICYVPQIIRIYKLKSARDISLPFTSMLFIGVIIWLIYGIILKLVPIIIWNSIGVVIIFTLLLSKLKFGK